LTPEKLEQCRQFFRHHPGGRPLPGARVAPCLSG
jgi:hypothetical protein